jgi:hypothetical protein
MSFFLIKKTLMPIKNKLSHPFRSWSSEITCTNIFYEVFGIYDIYGVKFEPKL